MKEIHTKNNIITSAEKKIIIIKIPLISTQSFIKEKQEKKMNKLFKGLA